MIVRGGIKLPDFDWVEIPGGEFVYGDDDKKAYSDYAPPADRQVLKLSTFSISRYPVTYAQFQTFIDDPEGFTDPRWWDELADDQYRRQNQSAPGEQQFKFGNHPRENVSWYDAAAFCRWLSWRLGGGFDLNKVGRMGGTSANRIRMGKSSPWKKRAGLSLREGL